MFLLSLSADGFLGDFFIYFRMEPGLHHVSMARLLFSFVTMFHFLSRMLIILSFVFISSRLIIFPLLLKNAVYIYKL